MQLNQARSKPGFESTVTELGPPKRGSCVCVAGPGDTIGTAVLFELAPAGAERTPVTCASSGWPGKDRKCNLLRGVRLSRLKQDAETGIARPAFP